MPVKATMIDYETQAAQNGLRFVFGVDEAGRGPLAGPVVAGAVWLKTYEFECTINDSKKMTEAARYRAFHEIHEKAVVGIGIISEQTDFNTSVRLLIDGNAYRSQVPYTHQTIIGGDAKSLSIACASIIAKVYRDRVMQHYHQIFPQYGFKDHKGYPTASHRQAIKDHGPSTIHRRSFTLL